MPGRARVTPGGLVYHVLNRSVAGLPLFRKQADFEAFERIMIEAHELRPIRILAWCLMRNHWYFILWPREEGEVTAYLRWLSDKYVRAVRQRLAGLVERIRQQRSDVQLIVRGDSGFCRENLMRWCENRGVDYILGLTKNNRLGWEIDLELELPYGVEPLSEAGRAADLSGRIEQLHDRLALGGLRIQDLSGNRHLHLSSQRHLLGVHHTANGFGHRVCCRFSLRNRADWRSSAKRPRTAFRLQRFQGTYPPLGIGSIHRPH